MVFRVTLALALALAFARPAAAASISVSLGGSGYLCQQTLFPANCSMSPTYQWVQGDYVGQDVAASGLGSIDEIGLSLQYDDLLNPAFSQTYSIEINGISVGSFTLQGVGDGLDRLVSSTYTFAPISGPDYEVKFVITSSTIPNGYGSFGWYNGDRENPSSFELVSTVPEPGTMMLTALGLAALARRRLRSHPGR
jgi:hypothetical protein